jgi:hypothetical protein
VAAPSPGGITPSTIKSPGPPGPSTEIRPGARAHNDPSLPVAATLRQPPEQQTNLNREAALDETASRQIRSDIGRPGRAPDDAASRPSLFA